MIKIISRFLKRVAGTLYLVSGKILPKTSFPEVNPSIQSIRVIPWFNDNGDKTHRLNYELNEGSVVFDLGGYEGQWAADIFCKYGCTIHIFEPFKEFANNIEVRFKRNSKVTIYNYGLTRANTKEKLTISADSSSTFKDGEESVEIQLVKIDDFLDKYNIRQIDLMKINIEGGEYDLLDHLVQSDKILIIQNIQVQFHDFVPNAIDRMHNIQRDLSKTHYLTYQYEFVWENWSLIK
jgi:FkbM family methyltransferase